jgi:4-amino-4-deoxy-L-arabinose transferase-like glycosyltransferase
MISYIKRLIKKYNCKYLILDILLLFIIYGSIFSQLNRKTINCWDEGIYATNTLEMSVNGNYLVKYFNNKPEMWGTEPPLASWLQLIFVKIFGYNEVSFRLPSAFAALFVVFLIIRLCSRHFYNRRIGYFSVLVLITSIGYIGPHVTRTCDLDSLLVLFTFFYVYMFYKYLVKFEPRYLYLSTLGIICALYTKSIAGLMFLPGLFIYSIYQYKLKAIFARKEIYFSIFAFIFFVLIYYLSRENLNPGYLKAAWNNEIAQRFFSVNQSHSESFDFYYQNLKEERFVPWFLFLPFCFLFIFKKGNERIKNLVIYILFVVIGFFFVISISHTKLVWYDAPLYPYLAILAGISLDFLFKGVKNLISINKSVYFILLILFCSVFFYYPYKEILKRNFQRTVYTEEKYGSLIKDTYKNKPQIKSYKILTPFFNPSACFYARLYNLNYHYNIRICEINNQIPINISDTIAFSHPAVWDKLNNFHYSILNRYDEVILVRVDSIKKNSTNQLYR